MTALIAFLLTMIHQVWKIPLLWTISISPTIVYFEDSIVIPLLVIFLISLLMNHYSPTHEHVATNIHRLIPTTFLLLIPDFTCAGFRPLAGEIHSGMNWAVSQSYDLGIQNRRWFGQQNWWSKLSLRDGFRSDGATLLHTTRRFYTMFLHTQIYASSGQDGFFKEFHALIFLHIDICVKYTL